jgi:pilus assembly protein Flp/PilA
MYLPREQGQGLMEYALILMLVAMVVISIAMVLGNQISSLYTEIMSHMMP